MVWALFVLLMLLAEPGGGRGGVAPEWALEPIWLIALWLEVFRMVPCRVVWLVARRARPFPAAWRVGGCRVQAAWLLAFCKLQGEMHDHSILAATVGCGIVGFAYPDTLVAVGLIHPQGAGIPQAYFQPQALGLLCACP